MARVDMEDRPVALMAEAELRHPVVMGGIGTETVQTPEGPGGPVEEVGSILTVETTAAIGNKEDVLLYPGPEGENPRIIVLLMAVLEVEEEQATGVLGEEDIPVEAEVPVIAVEGAVEVPTT